MVRKVLTGIVVSQGMRQAHRPTLTMAPRLWKGKTMDNVEDLKERNTESDPGSMMNGFMVRVWQCTWQALHIQRLRLGKLRKDDAFNGD